MTPPEFVAQWLGTVSASYTASQTYNPYADAFARAVAESLNTTTGTATKTTSDGRTLWTIDVGAPGYYLVKDTYTGDKSSVSSYILRVLGSTTVTIKASIPTVDKGIVSGSELVEGILTETETDVTYQLTGTVSENIAEYNTYTYTFTDTISKGLTLNGTDIPNLTVTYKNTVGATQNATFTKDRDYTATTAESDEKTILTVKFDNLKQALINLGIGIDLTNRDLAKNIQIIVTYTARLNKDAVIGQAGNPNDVVLSYSNNPYGEGTGETVHDDVNTYTLALRIVKQKVGGGPLDGVVFKLMKGNNNDPTIATNQFATFKQGTGTAGIAPGQPETYQEISGWETGGVASAGDELTTDAQGEFNIHGLSAGTYTLVETQALPGYETMKPIVFTITGTVGTENPHNGELTSATLTVADESTRHDVDLNSGSLLLHNAQLTLTNFESPILPHTGGIGAKVVYIVSGLTVLAGAAIVVMAMRKRTRGRHEQSR